MRTYPILLTSALALLATSVAPRAFAQPAAPTAATPDAAVRIEDPSRAAIARKDVGKDTLSVDFPDEDIRNILRNVADLFELNLVMPEALQGKTTIKLRDVTWRQIFQSVLSPVGYNYVEDGNIIKIVSNDSLQQEPTSTDVFILNYARAADIMPTVASLVDGAAGGKIVVDARSNSLVITERPSRMNRIRPIIEQLDKATDQVMIETKFIEVTSGDIKNLGVNWASLNAYTVNAGPFSAENRNLTSRDSKAGRIETNIDVPFMQNGYERADDLASRNGGGANIDPIRGIGPAFSDAATGRTYSTLGPASDISQIFSGTLSHITSAVFDAEALKVVLSALQTLQSTKVVSNPTIVTLNNTEATINVGESRPLPSYAFNEQRGTFEVNGFTFKDIGVNLKVTPQVNGRGFIKLTVEPEVSQSTRDAVFNGAAIPIIDVRKAKTQVSLKDGYTMGIGGLLKNSTGNGTTKVPVLGSIPVFGRLFKSESKNRDSTNLIIFITAKLVSAEGASLDQVFDPRTIRDMDIKREDLPGYRDGSDPFAVTPLTEKKSAPGIAKAGLSGSK
ncbi:MAG: secretin N-terminal domain-containing protein [Opitutaceae bacterium]